MKNIIILGSTGSIGTQALSVIDRYPDKFRVSGLACGGNYELLNRQIEKYRPDYVYISKNADKVNAGSAEMIKDVNELASVPCDLVITAMVGIAGLGPTVCAVKAGNNIALANKETLVAGGDYVMRLAAKKRVPILPVDSEHSALWQCADYGRAKGIKKLILTASGGAFRGYTREMLTGVGVQDALRHPTWKMGRKVTVDSATMMNKGLEIIEAKHLFNIGADKIDVLIHKESIVHSMVMYGDNSVIAELANPSMALPIQLAMTYPEKIDSGVAELDLTALGALTFEKPDESAFISLRLAKEAALKGGTAGAILNAANEIAVDGFINGKIGFLDIANTVRHVLDEIPASNYTDIEEIYECDMRARAAAENYISKIM